MLKNNLAIWSHWVTETKKTNSIRSNFDEVLNGRKFWVRRERSKWNNFYFSIYLNSPLTLRLRYVTLLVPPIILQVKGFHQKILSPGVELGLLEWSHYMGKSVPSRILQKCYLAVPEFRQNVLNCSKCLLLRGCFWLAQVVIGHQKAVSFHPLWVQIFFTQTSKLASEKCLRID